MANRVFIATSLDGYIARPDGSLDWLTSFPVPSQGDYGFDRFMEGISAIVMGRNTYETVLTFGDWPYSKPVVVLSSTLERIPDHLQSKVTLLQGHPREITSELNARGFSDLYIDGGKTIQSFLYADAIDELIISQIPVILGGGIPLFGYLEKPLWLEHAGTTVYQTGLVKSRYTRKT
ncbi:MAG: dihydrofolate reductase [Bacteroidetes bacterium]|nr:dihydrofolate reductase [Bacteroidota bacterium]